MVLYGGKNNGASLPGKTFRGLQEIDGFLWDGKVVVVDNDDVVQGPDGWLSAASHRPRAHRLDEEKGLFQGVTVGAIVGSCRLQVDRLGHAVGNLFIFFVVQTDFDVAAFVWEKEEVKLLAFYQTIFDKK